MVRFRGKPVRNAEAFREECVRAHDALSNLPDGECGVKDQVSRKIRMIGKYFLQGDLYTMFQDKTLVCKDCGKEFVWTAGEQEFYASRGFENQPQRCKACRDARKNATRGERQMFDAVCASCGKTCKVPFQPREDRPVYCSECFAKMKQN